MATHKKNETLVIGNWKMNPGSLATAKTLMKEVSARALRARAPKTEVGIAVPTLYLSELAKITKGKQVLLGAQNAAAGGVGAQTGEVSVGMLKEFHTAFAIIGHSERRARGETDAQVAERVHGVLAANIIPVVCIGETARDGDGHFYTTVSEQINAIFEGVSARKATQMVVAYEPVWAIGTGVTPTVYDISEMRLFIQKTLEKRYDAGTARKIRVLYGGSVTDENAGEMMREGMIDGFLVGGASLDATRFAAIVRAAARD